MTIDLKWTYYPNMGSLGSGSSAFKEVLFCTRCAN